MRISALAIALTVSLALGRGAAQAQVEAFNLDCNGAQTSATPQAVISTVPFHDILRVDLSRGIWCREVCWAHVPVVRKDRRYFYLADAGAGSPTGLFQAVYDTETRLFTEVLVYGQATSVTHANCIVRPFTGFPLNVKPPRLRD